MYVKPSSKNYFRIKSLTMKVFSEEWARLNREVGMTTVVLKNAPNNFVTSIYIYIYILFSSCFAKSRPNIQTGR